MSLLKTLLYVSGVVLVVLGCMLMLYHVYRRRRQEIEARERASKADLAHMMILMQSMRDMLDQQKNLARQLNENLDRKVTFIRGAVEEAMKDLDTLRTSVKAVASGIEQTRSELSLVRDTVRQARQDELPGVRPADEPAPPRKAAPPAETPAPNLASTEPPEPPRPLVQPDLLDNWVGLDFGDDSDETDFEVPDHLPEEPEHPEEAREAFRTLLNLEESAPVPGSSSGGNGRSRLSPLQVRVYEYSDAGMTVAQIAQELGIGKGEVRLILSLRRDREKDPGRR
jgi:hypothetical protein